MTVCHCGRRQVAFREPFALKYGGKKDKGRKKEERGSGGVKREEEMEGGRKGPRDTGKRRRVGVI